MNDVAEELKDGDFSVFMRLGTDVKSNFYEYEVPLHLTAPGKYNTNNTNDQYAVWPEANFMDVKLSLFTDIKKERNRAKHDESQQVGNTTLYTGYDPDHRANRVSVLETPRSAMCAL